MCEAGHGQNARHIIYKLGILFIKLENKLYRRLCRPGRAKALGGIGSMLIFIVGSFGPYPLVYIFEHTSNSTSSEMFYTIGWLLSFIGYTLVWRSLTCLGDYYNDEDLKRVPFPLFSIFGPFGWTSAIMFPIPATAVAVLITNVLASRTPATAFSSEFSDIILDLSRLAPFNVFVAVYLKKAYAALAAKSGQKLFDVAAELHFQGSAFIAAYSMLAIYLQLSLPFMVKFLPSDMLTGLWTSWMISAIAGFGLMWISWLISIIAFLIMLVSDLFRSLLMKLQQPDAAARTAPPA